MKIGKKFEDGGKSMKFKATAILGLALLLSAAPTWASLDTVDISSAGFGASSYAKVYGGGHNGTNTKAGLMKYDVKSTSGLGDAFGTGTTLGVFCVELTQSTSSKTKTYGITDVDSYFSDEKAALISELWGRYYDSAWLTSDRYTEDQKNAAEAFQVCIWEIIYEDYGNNLDVSSDDTAGYYGFRAKNVVTSLANSMLSSLDGTGTMAELTILTNGCSQDFVTASPVPEPATIAMLGLGMLVVTRTKRK
jgi:hypothetical protein